MTQYVNFYTSTYVEELSSYILNAGFVPLSKYGNSFTHPHVKDSLLDCADVSLDEARFLNDLVLFYPMSKFRIPMGVDVIDGIYAPIIETLEYQKQYCAIRIADAVIRLSSGWEREMIEDRHDRYSSTKNRLEAVFKKQ